MLQKVFTIDVSIVSLPAYHAAGADIYLASNINGWNPKDEKFKFLKIGGKYQLQLQSSEDILEFKLTRGGWDNVECQANGQSAVNRIIAPQKQASLIIKVEEWADRFAPATPSSTRSKNVQILDRTFYIPQLQRTRRIWIYLPEGYSNPGNDAHYPVLYMQDGQNLFDESTAYSGEWGVDKFLDATHLPKAIVVGVDNGSLQRITEYSCYQNSKIIKPEGAAYADFLANTLKPFIDKYYRTKANKANTFIAGSSMGGLISLSIMLKHPNVFGKAGIFSPAIWVGGTKIFEDLKQNARQLKCSIYLHCGELEAKATIANVKKVATILSGCRDVELQVSIQKRGSHSEASWQLEFPQFYKFLMD